MDSNPLRFGSDSVTDSAPFAHRISSPLTLTLTLKMLTKGAVEYLRSTEASSESVSALASGFGSEPRTVRL